MTYCKGKNGSNCLLVTRFYAYKYTTKMFMLIIFIQFCISRITRFDSHDRNGCLAELESDLSYHLIFCVVGSNLRL